MKTMLFALIRVTLALALLAATPVAYAQQDTPAGVRSTAVPAGQSATYDTVAQQGSSSGRANTSPKANTGAPRVPRGINADTEYATGEDLLGPPTHFPATQTPE